MKYLRFEDCNFHDSIIKKVDYDGKFLTLYIPESDHENTYKNLIVKIPICDGDFSIYHLKQHPRFHKIKFKGIEMSLRSLKSLFEKGYALEIVDVLVSVNENTTIMRCVLIPYNTKQGICEKIFFEFTDVHNIVFEQMNDDI